MHCTRAIGRLMMEEHFGQMVSFCSPVRQLRVCSLESMRRTLNLLRAPRRLGWLIWPWMGMAPKPRLRSANAILRELSHVRVKIMHVLVASSVST